MGRRTSRVGQKKIQTAKNALSNLAFDDKPDPRDLDVKHRRGSPSTGARFQKNLTPKNIHQQDFMTAIDTSEISFGIGPAGTGKTFIAVRKALEMLASNQVEKIVIARPAVEAEGERIGYLPGDIQEKLHPYMLPIYDILKEVLGAARLKVMIENEQIELCPLAFMRGRTFNNSVLVLDEMQNATVGQFKMALTRLGMHSKAIITGDPNQSDLSNSSSGLLPCSAKLENAYCVSVTRFGIIDVVRSSIVATVLEHLGE